MTLPLRRLTALAATATASMALSLAVAAPAQASPAECAQYLRDVGYTVSASMNRACIEGGSGEAGSSTFCQIGLTEAGVSTVHARAACLHAAN